MLEIHGKQVCETLEEVLSRPCCVLAIDMQNDAMRPDGNIARAGVDISMMEEMLPRATAFLEEARALGIPVIHIQVLTLRDGRSDSPSWLRAKGAITVEQEFFLEGTWGAEFCEEVAPLPGELVITKRRSSAFHQTDLDMILRSMGVETVVVIGEQTPGCIEATYRDAAYHDFYNVLIEDCVAAFDREQHDASILIQRRRHDVCLAEEALAVWRRTHASRRAAVTAA